MRRSRIQTTNYISMCAWNCNLNSHLHINETFNMSITVISWIVSSTCNTTYEKISFICSCWSDSIQDLIYAYHDIRSNEKLNKNPLRSKKWGIHELETRSIDKAMLALKWIGSSWFIFWIFKLKPKRNWRKITKLGRQVVATLISLWFIDIKKNYIQNRNNEEKVTIRKHIIFGHVLSMCSVDRTQCRGNDIRAFFIF